MATVEQPTQLTSSLTGTSVRLHRLRSTSLPLILSFRFDTLLFLLIAGLCENAEMKPEFYSS